MEERKTSPPAGTTVRFALLIALAVGVTVLVYLLVMPPGMLFNYGAQVKCQVVSGFYIDDQDISPFQVDRIDANAHRFRECMAQYLPLRLPWLAGGLLGLGGLAALIYFSLPRWRIRRRGLVPLSLTPELAVELDGLVERAGLRRTPVFLVDPVNFNCGGVAFGTRRQPCVCLDAGLVTRFRWDPAYFRVVVLHELAHLRNNDVPVTYLTIAVWRAFLVVGLVPFLATTLDPWLTSTTPFASPFPLWGKGYLFGIVPIFIQVFALVLVVLLSRNAVLRSREYHADDRAADWIGRDEPGAVLATVRASKHWWGGLISKHPLPGKRVLAVAEPVRLLRPGFWEAAAAGVAIQIAWRTVLIALTNIGQSGSFAMGLLGAVWGAITAVVLLFAGARFAAFRAGGGSPRVLMLTPIGIAVGLWSGQYIGVFSAPPGITLLELAVVAVLVLVLAALMWWVAHCADLIRELERPRARVLAWVAVVGAIFSFCSSGLSWMSTPSVTGGALINTLGPLGVGVERLVDSARWTVLDDALNSFLGAPLLHLFMGAPLVTAPLVLGWAIPLVLRRNEPVGTAIRAGVLGAAAWLVVELVLRGAAGASVGDALRVSDGFRWVLILWENSALLLAQFVVVVVLTARGVRVVTALFGAAVTALSAVLVLAVVRSVEGCFPSLVVFSGECVQTVSLSVPAIWLGLLVVAGVVVLPIALLLGRVLRRGSELTTVDSLDSRRIRLVPVAVAGIVVVLLALYRPSDGPGPIEEVTAAERGVPLAESERALRTWARGGGADHVLALMRHAEEYREALRQKDPRAYLRACVALVTASEQARKFPAPPGGTSSRLWSSALDEYHATGAVCRDVMTDVDLRPGRLELSGAHLHNATELLMTFGQPLIDS
ncbi:M48 family metalloprotease [Allokutzneria sp. NRRL B-24872]|uniref:M48 family metalloprotease n=1 Tax=Allokutzneria sp. NRRL B-24872 TaxID=1137961 RepID=UPI000A36BB5E|nr:M48 family metalloprotease [Allokutzneria sp. NRRL B-24872]